MPLCYGMCYIIAFCKCTNQRVLTTLVIQRINNSNCIKPALIIKVQLSSYTIQTMLMVELIYNVEKRIEQMMLLRYTSAIFLGKDSPFCIQVCIFQKPYKCIFTSHQNH